jgi:hypothetical protein
MRDVIHNRHASLESTVDFGREQVRKLRVQISQNNIAAPYVKVKLPAACFKQTKH